MRALPVRMLPHPSLAALSGPHRFLVIDGSGSQGPGARGTQYRVHLCMELVPLSLPCMAITDQRTGECLKHFALEPGEVAVADRSSCQPETDEQPFMALEQADLREIRPAVRISVLGAVLVLAEDEASGIAVICQQCELKESGQGWGTVDVVGRETTARLLVLPGSDGNGWRSRSSTISS
jgi:hypothetical protein